MGRLKGILVAAALLAAAPAYADLESIRQAALRGDAQKQVELAVLYQYGFGMDKKDVPALAWYIIAAEKGDPVAIQRRDALRARMAAPAVEAAVRESDMLRQLMADSAPASAAPTPANTPAP